MLGVQEICEKKNLRQPTRSAKVDGQTRRVTIDFERLLVSKIADNGRIQTALANGIREDHFTDESVGEIFSFMADHARKYKVCPSKGTIENQFPNHNFETTTESEEYIVEKFVDQIKRRRAIEAVRDIASALDDDSQVGNIDQIFLQKSRELAQIVPSANLASFKDIKLRIEEYERNDQEALGINMGIPVFDNLTQGIQPHDYVSIVGWQGTGKSTLAQWILFNAWKQGKTPMYISLEMESRALMRKWDTMLVNFEYNNLKAHTLREPELNNWKEKGEEVSKLPNDIITLDDVYGCTVDRVYAEIHRWKPDILCIDYITLMDISKSAGGNMWEKVTYITQALKQIARTSKVPIIGVAQTNINSAQEGASLDNISYSRSIGQDSDLVLGLFNNEEMKANKQMQVRMLKNRDGQTLNTDLYWNMANMEFKEWKSSDQYGKREREIDLIDPKNVVNVNGKLIDRMTGEVVGNA